MNNLIGSAKTIDSREVAEMIEMRHTDLLRKIEGYIDALSQNAKLRSDDYFIESTYTAGTGKAYKCYELTKMGCEMVANKLTGDKGILFTAEYVKRFNEMEQPMSQIDIIIQSALALKTIEQEQKRLKQAQEAQEQRLLEIESKQMTIDKNHYTIIGYANLMGIRGVDRGVAANLGRKASKLSNKQGYHIGKEYDAKYGAINTYHVDILQEIFRSSF